MNPSWLGKGEENSPKNIAKILDFAVELEIKIKRIYRLIFSKYANAVSKIL